MSHDEDGASEAEANGKTGARKERVLHTRIPAHLEDEIKKLADKLRIPVSNLVRNILQDAVEMVDGFRNKAGDQLAGVAESIRPKRPAANGVSEAPAPTPVLAWQPITLAVDASCQACSKSLPAGADARMGVSADPGARLFVCLACARKRARKAKKAG